MEVFGSTPWGPLAIGAHVAKKFVMTRAVTQMFREQLHRIELIGVEVRTFTTSCTKTEIGNL